MANIEPIGPEHAAAVWPLSIEAGWNQNVADWQFMLTAGRGFGVRNETGSWEASSLVLPLGDRLAWISMVLVTKSRRRGGVGTTLLRRCIDEATSRGAVAGLDATEQGRPIYLPLGFRDLYKISRWHLESGGKTIAARPGIKLRPLLPADLPQLAVFDRARSGMVREALLRHLAERQPGMAWMAETELGGFAGFALGREGRIAASVGPVVADSEGTALALISQATSAGRGPFILDTPDMHGDVRRWLEQQGAVSPRGYMRMTLGPVMGLENPAEVFALAGPELG
jgi:GNAT superfamily N-acetyltransferase